MYNVDEIFNPHTHPHIPHMRIIRIIRIFRIRMANPNRDPVRWYESVKNTVLQVVGWINGPATRYNQGARFQQMTIPVTRFNPIMQLLLKLSGQGAISVVPAVSC